MPYDQDSGGTTMYLPANTGQFRARRESILNFTATATTTVAANLHSQQRHAGMPSAAPAVVRIETC